MEITDLLIYAQKNNASDLHIASANKPLMRVYGEITPVPNSTIADAGTVKQMIYSIMTEQQRSDYERDFEVDFAISFGEKMRFRVNAFNTISGPAAVLRAIPSRILSLEELNTPEVFKKLTELKKGLILVTGPTGSGKSTTLAAMVNHINENTQKHILTIEDPIEFVHPSKKALVNQREVGANTKSFGRALKSALREDPDVILVGELRDLETIQLAMTAAETGHLVLATLHTNSAPKTIDRIIDVFPSQDKEMVRAMLSVSLEAIITQTLLKRADGQGRIASFEILLGSPAIRNLVREGKIPQIYSLMQMSSKLGMVTMKDYVFGLMNDGIITADAARAHIMTGTSDENEEMVSIQQTKKTVMPTSHTGF